MFLEVKAKCLEQRVEIKMVNWLKQYYSSKLYIIAIPNDTII